MSKPRSSNNKGIPGKSPSSYGNQPDRWPTNNTQRQPYTRRGCGYPNRLPPEERVQLSPSSK